MKNEKYEPIKFDTWQDLAKYVIDGGEVYYGIIKVTFDGMKFNHALNESILDRFYVKKQPTLEELIAIKPRLCWVWNGYEDIREVVRINEIRSNYYHNNRCWWSNAQMLTDDEIKQFLSNGE